MSDVSTHRGASRRRAERRVLPDAGEAVDAVFLLAASSTALSGLGSTFTGWGYLGVGAAGLIIGVVLTHLCAARGLPTILAAAGAVAAFYLLGPVLCLRAEGHPLPGPAAWGALTDQAIFGWKDLLTTLPPIDGDGPLLTLPWLMGLVAGVLGTVLARVRRGPTGLRVALPVVAPLALLGLVILIGRHTPHVLWVEGAVTAVLVLAWLVLRAQRERPTVHSGSGRVGRLVTGGVLLGLAGAAALPVATWATGGSDVGRVVFRNYVEPPFDIGQYPSPLASFRRYVEYPTNPPAGNLYDTPLMTVEGLAAGTRVRFATLDDYDGVVWGAANDTVPGSTDDVYQRVGSTLDNPTDGRDVDVRITLDEGYTGVWLPLAGALQSVDFLTHTDLFAQDFRYNLETSTGVVPPGLTPGDAYTFTAVLPDDALSPDDEPSGLVGTAAQGQTWLEEPASEWSEGATTPMQRVFAIADHLRTEGKYSDGVTGRERIYRPGHFVDRLNRSFLTAPQIVGNDEQYAAAMALLANYVGVPARVVFGATVPEDGVVEGSDVSAWVELQIADGSWRVLPTEQFMGTEKPADQQTKNQQQLSGLVIPPPAQVPPPSTLGEQTDSEITAKKVKRDDESDSRLPVVPGWARWVLTYVGGPLLGIALVLLAIVAAKLLRRRRRRGSGPPSSRIVGGWRDLVDHARELGLAVPTRGVTRGDQAALIATPDAAGLARRADVTIFARSAPEPEAAADFWAAVDEERRALSAGVTRRRRLLGAIDPRSLRR